MVWLSSLTLHFHGDGDLTDGNKKIIRNCAAEFLIFTAQAVEQSIEARYENESHVHLPLNGGLNEQK